MLSSAARSTVAGRRCRRLSTALRDAAVLGRRGSSGVGWMCGGESGKVGCACGRYAMATLLYPSSADGGVKACVISGWGDGRLIGGVF